MDYQTVLNRLLDGEDLTAAVMEALMADIMAGKWSEVQLAGLLVALRAKGESVDEIAAAAKVMRELSLKVEPRHKEHLIDTCGTGGDGTSSFNISTGAALVAAAAGAHVAKHGNRAVSSASGSADVLRRAGARLELPSQAVARAIDEIGFGFIYAPQHHGAMKHVAPARRALGIRTIFNLLGPLTNPAGCKKQLIGLFDARWLRPLAQVLHNLGSEHVLLVHSQDGMDEISPFASTDVVELRQGQIRALTLNPADYAVAAGDSKGQIVASPAESLAKLRAALTNEDRTCAQAVALNAGAALYVAGLASDIKTGVEQARQILAEGAAIGKLEDYIAFTQSN